MPLTCSRPGRWGPDTTPSPKPLATPDFTLQSVSDRFASTSQPQKSKFTGKKRYEGDGSHEVRLAAAASLCCKCRCDRNGGQGLHQGTCSVCHTSWAPSRLRDPRGARPAESRTKVKWRPKLNQISRPLCKWACAPNPQTGPRMALRLEEKRSQGPSRQGDLWALFGKDGRWGHSR